MVYPAAQVTSSSPHISQESSNDLASGSYSVRKFVTVFAQQSVSTWFPRHLLLPGGATLNMCNDD